MELTEARTILGIAPGAGVELVKTAYRNGAKILHPQASTGDTQATDDFIRLKLAYDIMMRVAHKEEETKDFASAFIPDTNEPIKGKDLRVSVQVSLEMIAHGGKIRVSVPSGAACPECDGTGRVEGGGKIRCPVCRGAGRAWIESREGRLKTICPSCNGAGWADAARCHRCAGSGSNPSPVLTEVWIPPGIEDDDFVRVARAGSPGRNGAPAGDLLVVIEAAPHTRFRRRGSDLLASENVSFADLCLGGSVDIRIPGISNPISVTIPPFTPSDSVLTVEGAGLPRRDGGKDERGVLMLRVRPRVPSVMSKSQIEVMKKWRTLDKMEGK
jgi:molecular chaperone DnaJ